MYVDNQNAESQPDGHHQNKCIYIYK